MTSNINANYETCEQCITLRVDNGDVIYFQSAGTLTIRQGSRMYADPPDVDLDLDGVFVREVTIDPITLVSTPVVGGGCFRLESRNMWTQ